MDPNAETTALDRPWPDAVDDLLSAADMARRSGGSTGRSEAGWTAVGSQRWSNGALAVARLASSAQCGRQVELLENLARVEFPVATVVGSAERWLVTSQPSGLSAGSPDHHPDPDDLVGAVGRGLRLLHQVDLSALPADRSEAESTRGSGWSAVAERCRRAVEAGLVDTASLPTPYDRYRPDQLLAMLIDGRPADEDPVLCHGGAAMGRFLVDKGTFQGFDFLDTAVVADPHLDLAALHLDLQRLMGPESVFRFYESYGTDPNLVRLDHCLLATHLLTGSA